MRASILCALFSLFMTGCHETTSTPSSVPPLDLSGTVTDLGAAADQSRAGALDMTAARFPLAAAVTVGPGGTLTFAPATVDIAAGGTVTWSWAAGNTMLHNVTSGDTPAAFAPSPTQTSGSFAHPFASAGSFFYYCTVHGRSVMFGTVNVH
jgi:plastocyanin